MKTYYLHGKIMPNSFHLKCTLLKIPPKGYYLICEQIADSRHQAVRMIIELCSLHPPKGKEVQLNINSQGTFLNES